MPDLLTLAGYAAAGYAQKVVDATATSLAVERMRGAVEHTADPDPETPEALQLARRTVALLEAIRSELAQPDTTCGPITETTVLPAAPNEVAIRKRNRSHVMLFVPVATTLTFSVAGLGVYTKAVAAADTGWYAVDFPEGTGISATGPTTVIVALANNRWGRTL